MNKDANEVLLTILNEESGFFLHLEKHDISRDVMAYVLLALGKAITSYMHSNVNSLINDVTSSKYSFQKGSLLCLSSDDFQTMLFATVARREPKDLRNGFLLLRFDELTDEVLALSPLRSLL
ncbi:hypothetical protein TNCT_141791 [Trichonephila clavata]|uniref:ZNFX1 domain-containing protein n=1 Tax=Trichonephila clavata TaxID=2740835 RepID=A0A8X6FY57_TRICU|nr:hypothetical protein TNCT_141791 [Trichonephila clavata]